MVKNHQGWDGKVRWDRLAGPLLTVLAILLVETLAGTLLLDHLPLRGMAYSLVLGAVVYAALKGGHLVGLGSGLLAGAYSLYYYNVVHRVFPQDPDRLLLGASVAVFTVGLAALVARVKSHADKLAERALVAERQHSGELRAKNEELARANAALAEANDTLESFSYVVSHDLKEPVRALSAFSRALAEDHAAQLPAEARELAEREVEASARLARLLDGLLDYARVSRLSASDLQPLRVEEILASPECAARYDHLLQERAARLLVTPGPALLASPPLLAQLLGNLVLNALKHNPRAKPLVKVSSRTSPRDEAFVEVRVEDNGPGFPPAVQARFNHPAQGRPSTVRSGFGLLIARRSVERLGGTMRLDASEEMGGALVHLTLPAASAPLEGRPGPSVARVAGSLEGAPRP